MGWESSDRRSRLPGDWAKRVKATKRRARGMCEATSHEPECEGVGHECDHHIPGDDHSLGNLRWLSTPCHAAKTRREARAGVVKRLKQREPERHPGLR